MSDENKLDELLVQWGNALERGQRLTAQDICVDCPELAAPLAERIRNVESVQAFIQLDDEPVDDFHSLPSSGTVANGLDDTQVFRAGVSLDQFCQRIVDAGLMASVELAEQRRVHPATDALVFARQLISSKKLTRFQATVLLEGRDLPLVLDRYVILDEIGTGGMGAVFKALHQQMDRVVALKILPKSAVDSGEKVKRFQREMKAAAKLHHPNVVTAFDAREDKGIYFLVMELVDGQDLAKLVHQSGPLSAATAMSYIAQAARGLEHAHNLGIVHRDIKPANLLLDRQGTVKILDMGLARMDSLDQQQDHTLSQDLTQAGMVMGTVAYLAPEQALDTRHADARSDMYSLGCTLYYLLAGRPLFAEDTMMKTVLAHREREVPPLPGDHVPAELDRVYRRMVAKRPEDRFQSMTALLAAIEPLKLQDEVVVAPRSVVPAAPSQHETAKLIDTTREFHQTPAVKAQAHQPPRRRWTIIAACLAGFLFLTWAATIIFKVETKAGTIILEIDQLELAGAEVSVDGEKRITIRSGEGQEPINIEADEKTHSLKVTKGGFEAFVTSFTVKAGQQQTIKVRLDPVRDAAPVATIPQRTPASPSPEPPSAAAFETWALELDGVDDFIEIPTLNVDATKPLTFEAWCVVAPGKQLEKDNVDPLFVTNTLTKQGKGNVLIFDRLQDGYWMASQSLAERRTFSNHLYHNKLGGEQRHHIAAVWSGGEKKLFFNGRMVAQGGSDLGAFDTDVDDSDLSPAIGKALLLHIQELRYFVGTIDELRISSSARYTTEFTPQDRLSADEQTLTLYHFDDGFGTGLLDASGNGHHGVIHGGKWKRIPASGADRSYQAKAHEIARWVLSQGGWVANAEKKFEQASDLTPDASIVSVFLSGNPSINAEDLQQLTQLEALVVLALSNSNLTDQAMTHVGRIKTLERLDLQNAQITGQGLRELAGLAALKTLWANGLQVTDDDVAFLAKCRQLEELSLSSPTITDASIPHFKQLKKLKALNLSGTSITPAGKDSLRDALKDCHIP